MVFMHVADPDSRLVALEMLNPSWFSLLKVSVLPRPKRKRDHMTALGPLATKKLIKPEVCMYVCRYVLCMHDCILHVDCMRTAERTSTTERVIGAEAPRTCRLRSSNSSLNNKQEPSQTRTCASCQLFPHVPHFIE